MPARVHLEKLNISVRFTRYVAERSRFVGEHSVALPEINEKAYPSVARPELVSEWEKVFYAAIVEAG